MTTPAVALDFVGICPTCLSLKECADEHTHDLWLAHHAHCESYGS